MSIKTYKGFDKNLKCRDFQYAVGKTYKITETPKACENGFHACENPIDCFSYYPPADSVYHEVDQDGKLSHDKNDSKIASQKITIGLSIGFKSMIEASVKFMFSKCDWTKKENHTTGYQGAASQTGYQGAASQTGDRGAASQTGNYGAAIVTGENSAAEILKPKETFFSGTAISLGINGKARAPIGGWIVLAEWKKPADSKWILKSIKSVLVDGKKIKGDIWYSLINGKFVIN